jgi:predicted acyltransferase (DUF342 family)
VFEATVLGQTHTSSLSVEGGGMSMSTVADGISHSSDFVLLSSNNVGINKSSVSANANLDVSGTAAVSGNMTITGSATLNDTLTVSKAVSLNSVLNVSNDVSFGGTLTALGAATLSSTLDVDGATNITGSLTTTGVATLNSTLDVIGATNITGALITTGDVSFNSRLQVGGDVSLNGDLTIEGNLNVFQQQNTSVINTTVNNYEVIISNDLSINGYLYTADDVSFNNNAYIAGNTTINSRLDVAGDVSLNGGLFVKNDATIKFVENKVYTVSVSSGKYYIDGSEAPTLSIVRGSTYVFELSASGHPFYIQTTDNNGAYDSSNVYNDGVTNNGNQTGTLTFVVPLDAPSTLYYRCEYHSNMGGTINISDAPGSNLFVSGDVSLNNNLLVGGTTTMNNRLDVAGDVSLNNDVSVEGNTTLNGDVTMPVVYSIFQFDE